MWLCDSGWMASVSGWCHSATRYPHTRPPTREHPMYTHATNHTYECDRWCVGGRAWAGVWVHCRGWSTLPPSYFPPSLLPQPGPTAPTGARQHGAARPCRTLPTRMIGWVKEQRGRGVDSRRWRAASGVVVAPPPFSPPPLPHPAQVAAQVWVPAPLSRSLRRVPPS